MAVMVNPGELRVALTLERAEETPDGAGGYTEDWIEVAQLFTKVEPIAADFRFGADQTLEEVTHRITIRARADVASGMRLRRGDRLFDILTVHDLDETGRYLVIRAKEKGR